MAETFGSSDKISNNNLPPDVLVNQQPITVDPTKFYNAPPDIQKILPDIDGINQGKPLLQKGPLIDQTQMREQNQLGFAIQEIKNSQIREPKKEIDLTGPIESAVLTPQIDEKLMEQVY